MLGNLHRERLETRLYIETLAAGRTTVSLPDRLIDRVVEVKRSKMSVKKSQFRFIPGSNIVQVASDFTRSHEISICYQVAISPDLFIADADDGDRVPVFAQVHRKTGHLKDGGVGATRNTGTDQTSPPKTCAELYREKSSSIN